MTNGTITSQAQMMFTYAVGAALAECEKSRQPIDPKTLRETLSLHVHEIQSRPDLGEQDAWGVGKLLDLVFDAADALGH